MLGLLGAIQVLLELLEFLVLKWMLINLTCPDEGGRDLTISRIFFRRSLSRRPVSSRSFSTFANRESREPSRVCQFSLATAYWVCKVSIWRRSLAWVSPVAPDEASSARERRL